MLPASDSGFYVAEPAIQLGGYPLLLVHLICQMAKVLMKGNGLLAPDDWIACVPPNRRASAEADMLHQAIAVSFCAIGLEK